MEQISTHPQSSVKNVGAPAEGTLGCNHTGLSRGRPRAELKLLRSSVPCRRLYCLPRERSQAMPVLDLTQTIGTWVLLCFTALIWLGLSFLKSNTGPIENTQRAHKCIKAKLKNFCPPHRSSLKPRSKEVKSIMPNMLLLLLSKHLRKPKKVATVITKPLGNAQT